MKTLQNHIDGRPLPPSLRQYWDNRNPATGEVISRFPASTEEDVTCAIAAAKSAFPSWAALSGKERRSILLKLAEGIERERGAFARAETLDTGKPITLSRELDIPRSAANFRFFADALLAFGMEKFPGEAKGRNCAVSSPLGVVGCISPWNLPLYLLTWKIAPALAMGNTVVAKPSEWTPSTASLLGELWGDLCGQIGLPPGVLNIVHGDGHQVGGALCRHPDVQGISFTGSTVTGRSIAQACAPHFKKVSLEMGGKNPTIVFADCDEEKALEGTLKAAFTNQGQICLCGPRIFIERPLYKRFKDTLVERAHRQFRPGDPQDPKTRQGALISQAHLDKVRAAVEEAKREGGTILTGGRSPGPEQLPETCAGGFFFEPTLIEGLPPSCATNREEIFGPVATLTPFDSEEEVIAWANDTRYGLAASIWTKDLDKAHRVAHHLETGLLWINTWMLRDLRTPFGGVKESGLGREGGHYSLHFFSHLKNICEEVETP